MKINIVQTYNLKTTLPQKAIEFCDVIQFNYIIQDNNIISEVACKTNHDYIDLYSTDLDEIGDIIKILDLEQVDISTSSKIDPIILFYNLVSKYNDTQTQKNLMNKYKKSNISFSEDIIYVLDPNLIRKQKSHKVLEYILIQLLKLNNHSTLVQEHTFNILLTYWERKYKLGNYLYYKLSQNFVSSRNILLARNIYTLLEVLHNKKNWEECFYNYNDKKITKIEKLSYKLNINLAVYEKKLINSLGKGNTKHKFLFITIGVGDKFYFFFNLLLISLLSLINKRPSIHSIDNQRFKLKFSIKDICIMLCIGNIPLLIKIIPAIKQLNKLKRISYVYLSNLHDNEWGTLIPSFIFTLFIGASSVFLYKFIKYFKNFSITLKILLILFVFPFFIFALTGGYFLLNSIYTVNSPIHIGIASNNDTLYLDYTKIDFNEIEKIEFSSGYIPQTNHCSIKLNIRIKLKDRKDINYTTFTSCTEDTKIKDYKNLIKEFKRKGITVIEQTKDQY